MASTGPGWLAPLALSLALLRGAVADDDLDRPDDE